MVVATIFNKVLARRIDGVDSAFYREGIPGVVYIEARNYGAVLTVLKGINNVWLRYYKTGYYKTDGGPIDLVPISERLALLTLNVSPVNEVEKAADERQRFVRIRDRTRYRNQLAIIGGYVMDRREALVLVVPRAGTQRRFAAPPTLKRAAPVEGEDANSAPLITSDGVDDLQSVSSEGQYLSGLEVRRIDVSKLVYYDIHPAAHELDLFEATQHDEICELVRNARNLQIRQGEKFEVTQGPWKGFKGVVEDTMVTDPDILIRMKGRYSWEDIEVPRSDLICTGPKGCTTAVKAGPYIGLTGRIHEYLGEDMVFVSPDAGEEQIVDVRVSDIQRTVDPGDEVEIILGSLKGQSGFYVSTDDEAKARIYLPSTPHGRMVRYSLLYECFMRSNEPRRSAYRFRVYEHPQMHGMYDSRHNGASLASLLPNRRTHGELPTWNPYTPVIPFEDSKYSLSITLSEVMKATSSDLVWSSRQMIATMKCSSSRSTN